jgi:hypothetical protein
MARSRYVDARHGSTASATASERRRWVLPCAAVYGCGIPRGEPVPAVREDAAPCREDHPEPLVRHGGRGGSGRLQLRVRQRAHRERHPLHRSRAPTGRHGDDRGVRSWTVSASSASTAAPSSPSTRPSPSRSTARPRTRSTTTGDGCRRAVRKGRAAGCAARPTASRRPERPATGPTPPAAPGLEAATGMARSSPVRPALRSG